jgi:hypothetical protein
VTLLVPFQEKILLWLKLGIGTKPHFPTIFGIGFFVHHSGLAVTNRHVVEIFGKLPRTPRPKNRRLLR